MRRSPRAPGGSAASRPLNPNITGISQGQYIKLPPPTTAGMGGTPNPNGNFINASQGAMVDPRAFAGGLATPGSVLRTNVSSAGGIPPYIPGNGFTPQASYSSPSAPVNPALAGMGGLASPFAMQTQAAALKMQLANAKDPSQLPAQIGNGYLSMLGVTPSQMLSAGYVLQAGNWVRTGKGTVAGSGAAGGLDPNRPDHLRLVTMNRNAKNKKNRYVTTLKDAKNVWKRKRRGSGPAKQPGSNVRADAPSTTLDLVLGS